MTVRIITGDCRDVLPTLDAGSDRHCGGQFKKGRHWRKPELYWNREWLFNEYVVKGKSAHEIALQFDCKENNILYFLKKYSVLIRSISEARAIKHWGSCGSDNGMHGRSGEENPNWKGRISPERQAFYSSQQWSNTVKRVWRRDKAKCQRCERHAGSRGKSEFHIHHIASFENKKLRTVLANLVLLCRKCHYWIHSRKNEEGLFIHDG